MTNNPNNPNQYGTDHQKDAGKPNGDKDQSMRPRDGQRDGQQGRQEDKNKNMDRKSGQH